MAQLTTNATPIRLGLILIASIALYVIFCFASLATADDYDLMRHYCSKHSSQLDPIYLPMPRWVTDVHWQLVGRQRVVRANTGTSDYVIRLTGAVDLARRAGDPMDEVRTSRLLAELVEPNCGNPEVMRELRVYLDAEIILTGDAVAIMLRDAIDTCDGARR